jgi:dTDP-glucose 4,6-dehydratase
VSILELAQLVRELAGSTSPVVHVPRPEDDPTVRRPDITLAREQLGWEPRVDLAEGLRRTIAWFETLADGTADAAV